jgi:flagellar P-ring protein precursor FlgI
MDCARPSSSGSVRWLRTRWRRRMLGVLPVPILLASSAGAQEVRIGDLVLTDAAPATRLMGYGIVTGLSGTGDRVSGTSGAIQTVQSIVNLLRRFGVEIPATLLRTRNVAAVLVTAEVSPYLRPGGRFDVNVSSIGDAQSLRGGVLWMTPLVTEAGGKPFAAAQGPLLVSEVVGNRRTGTGGTTARIPNGGALEVELARPAAAPGARLLLREPDALTAARIAAAVDSAFGGPGSATVEDPGAVALSLKDTSKGAMAALARIRELRIRVNRVARIVIDGRDGTIVAGGDLLVGEAVVSHGPFTVSVGASADSATAPGDLRVPTGTSVQRVASALHAMRASASDIAAIFEALRGVGAISAEIVAR